MAEGSQTLVQILSPFGEWPHEKGLQIVDKLSAAKMIARSRGVFAGKIPIYIGHPDDNAPASKCVPVGRIMRIASTRGGIVVEAKYPRGIFEKVSAGKPRAMSPRWQMEDLGNGRFRPVKLISVGLTNNPNIPQSGRILSAGSAPNEALVRTLSERTNDILSLSAKAENAFRKMRDCAQKAEAAYESASRTGIAERIAAAAKSAFKIPAKPSAVEIARRAAAESRATGTPYTERFAALRRINNLNSIPANAAIRKQKETANDRKK